LTSVWHSEFDYQLRNTSKENPLFFKGQLAMFATVFFVVFGAAVGILLAVGRYPSPALAPTAAFFGSAAMISGIIIRHAPETMAIDVLLSIAAPQVAYIATALAIYLAKFSKVLSTTQAAIGPKLATVFELPRAMPPRMVALLVKLHQASPARTIGQRVANHPDRG
jgi:hypothetical protein